MPDLSNYLLSFIGVLLFVIGRLYRAVAPDRGWSTEFAWLFDLFAFCLFVGGLCVGRVADTTESLLEGL